MKVQWQELKNQALIFKHFLAGVPVPPSLLLSIRRSLGSSPACFYTNPTLSYYSYFGKKFDPDPGRCRRTDGKKWRCSRDAYPDSKYCERHMHRGKTRSRKPVESQTLPQLQSSSSSSTVTTSFTPSGPTNRCFQNDSLQFSITGGCSDHSSKLDKDYSYLKGTKTDVDIHTFILEATGKSKGFATDSSVDTSVLSYPQLQKSSYIGNEFDFLQPMEQESSSVRPFLTNGQKHGTHVQILKMRDGIRHLYRTHSSPFPFLCLPWIFQLSLHDSQMMIRGETMFQCVTNAVFNRGILVQFYVMEGTLNLERDLYNV